MTELHKSLWFTSFDLRNENKMMHCSRSFKRSKQQKVLMPGPKFAKTKNPKINFSLKRKLFEENGSNLTRIWKIIFAKKNYQEVSK